MIMAPSPADATAGLPAAAQATEDTRRLACSVVEGARPPTEHHHASFEVRPEGARSGRLIWTTDVLPHALAPEIRIRDERGTLETKQAVEATAHG